MRVVFLGIGGWISRPRLGFTSMAVVSKENILLLDAGEGVYQALERCCLDHSSINTVFLSHRHGDHILGLPTLVQIAKHQRRKLRIVGSQDVIYATRLLLEATGVNRYDEYIDFVEVSTNSELHLGSYALRFAEVNHPVPCLAIRVESEGRCVVYSGDTSYSEALANLARGCDLLIHEVSGYSAEAHTHGHSTVYDAVRTAVEAGVKKLAIVHFYMDSPVLRPEVLKPLIEAGIELAVPYPCYSIEL